MRIRCGYTIALDTFGPTPMTLLLNVRPERRADLNSREVITFDPPLAARQFLDPFGNVATRILVPGGRITMSADFEIEDHGKPDDHVPEARQILVQDLPDEALPFLMGCSIRTTRRQQSSTPCRFSKLSISRTRRIRTSSRRRRS